MTQISISSWRASAITAAALAALAGVVPAQAAGLAGTLVPGLGFDVTIDGNGQQTSVGFIQPSVAAPQANALTGGRSAARGVGIGNEEFYVTGSGFFGARAVAVTPTGSYRLDPLGASTTGYGASSAQGVDDAGNIAGTSDLWTADSLQDLGPRPAWWAPGASTPQALPMPAGFADSGGHGWGGSSGISRSGVIIGYATQYDGDVGHGQRGLRWMSATAAPEVLLPLPGSSASGDARSAPVAVNAKGAVVGAGDLYDAAGNWVGLSALRWDAGKTAATALDRIGASPQGQFACHAVDINDAGTSVGSCGLYDDSNNWTADVPVRWTAKSTQAVRLESLGSDRNGRGVTYAMGINAAGTIFGVGEQYTSQGDFMGQRAARWLAGDTKPQLLKPLSKSLSGQTYTYAYAINSKGWIAGSANFRLGNLNYYRDPVNLTVHAVVWSPDGKVHDLNALLPAGSPWKLYNVLAISDTNLVTGLGWYLPEAGSLTQPYPRLFTMQLSRTGAGE